MNIRHFFNVASPATLASLIADIHPMGTGAGHDELCLEQLAEQALRNNVGDDEAERMIDEKIDLARKIRD